MAENGHGLGASRPIFLHAAWRSNSTFYWLKFRARPGTLCFYEPLHHGLARLTPRRILGDDANTAAYLRHPKPDAPYFAEFAPLLRPLGGVRRYGAHLAYERFHMAEDESHPGLHHYISGLLEHARSQGRRAVLGFNRTGGRVAWLKRKFAAFDIHIDRDPAAMWGSYTAERARGNNAFFSMWLRILEANQHHPVWAPLAERMRPRGPIKRRLSMTGPEHRARIVAMDETESYLLVFYAWLATAPPSMAVCDLVIDDGLASLPHHARRLEEAIEAGCGLRVDLSGVELRPPRMVIDETVRRRVEAEALALFPRAALPHRSAATIGHAAPLSARKAELLAALA
jgi:hypothetical protein